MSTDFLQIFGLLSALLLAYGPHKVRFSEKLIFHQRKSTRRRGRTRRAPVFCRQDSFHIFWFQISPSDLHQRAGHNSYHIIEKTSSCYPDGNHISGLVHFCLLNLTNGIFSLRIHAAKAFEVVRPDKISGRFPHTVHVKANIGKVCIEPLRRHRKFRVINSVFIGFPAVAMSRMKCNIHFF